MAKRQMEEIEKNNRIALEVLVEHGFAGQCEAHEEYFDLGAGDPAADSGQSVNMIAALRNEGFSGTDEEASAVLADALRGLGDECGYCAKNRDS